jgi:prolyl-tRNA synthetase
LKKSDIRVHYDNRDNYNPGWKYNHWELKGVPIRIELGPKDVEKNEARCVLRYNGEKLQISQDGIVQSLSELLEKIQNNMYQNALNKLNEKKKNVTTW